MPKSEFSRSKKRGNKGGGGEGRSGDRVNRAWRGKRGKMREKGWEERGPKAQSKNSDFGTLLI